MYWHVACFGFRNMTSSWLPRLPALLAPVLCLTLQALAPTDAAASACDADTATRWVPQRSWPAACEPDAVTDGLVLLEGDALPLDAPGGEGELHVVVQRMVAGQPVETFEGKVSRPDATSALFQSERPLAPHTDYQISAVRVGLDGSELGYKFTSAFTTGARSVAPLAFEGAPTLRYEEVESERFECVTDACGDKRCTPGDELVQLKSVRVAVPSIVGGVDLRAYAVSAKLTASFSNGQAPVVATSDTAATQAGKRSFIVLELPALPAAAEGCVTITATDAAGHTLTSEPVCTALPGDEQPYDDEGPAIEVLDQLGLSQTSESATEVSGGAPVTAEASAQGCAIGQNRGSLGSLGWLGLALTVARLRTRKRVVGRFVATGVNT
jgi:hypothetical protein